MARIHARHGRIGTATEYHEYHIVNPKVVIQTYGEAWQLWVLHVDNTWQSVALYPTEDTARTIARKLIGQYATAILENIADYRKMASDLAEQYAHLTTAGTPVRDTEEVEA